MNELTVIVNDMTDFILGPDDRAFVYAVARRIVGSAHDADDVTQEAMLLAHRYRDAFRGESHYRSWLYRIAATAAYGHLRKRRRSLETACVEDEAHVVEQLADPAKSAETRVLEAETHALAQRALVALSPTYRAVLLARVDATEPEAAKKLGISLGNVKIRTHRARKQIRTIFDRMYVAA
jgi:RNA polymerase sigma-70 factor (ECF subfamily)